MEILSSSLVPVLIGIIGTFEIQIVDIAIRVIAIFLSIIGTISTAIENVYSYRQRGQTRIHYADKMNTLFQTYDANCGKFRNSVSGLDDYMNEFHQLLENTRNDSFIGQYKNSESFESGLL